MGLAQSPCGEPMSGLKGVPSVLLCLTCNVTSVSKRLTRCRVSGSKMLLRSVRSMPRSMVSKARDISRRRRWTVRSSAHTACSIKILKVKTNSVVLLPGLYAACVKGVSHYDVSVDVCRRITIRRDTLSVRRETLSIR